LRAGSCRRDRCVCVRAGTWHWTEVYPYDNGAQGRRSIAAYDFEDGTRQTGEDDEGTASFTGDRCSKHAHAETSTSDECISGAAEIVTG